MPGRSDPSQPPPEPAEGSRWRRYEETLRERLEAAASAAESRRSRSHVTDAAFLIWDRNRALPASLLVGAMASRIVIYLIPLFALLIFSFGLYGDVAEESAGQAARGAGMPALIAEAASDSTALNEGFRCFAVVATIYATLYAANSLGRLLRRGAALIGGVPYAKPARIVLTIFWLLVSRLLPRDPRATRFADLFPGALFVSLGVVGLRVAMIVYFAPSVETLSERYGSIGLALVMLTWAYWLGMIVIGSTELNAALFLSREARGRR